MDVEAIVGLATSVGIGWTEVGVLVQANSQLVIKNILSSWVGCFISKSMIFQFALGLHRLTPTVSRRGRQHRQPAQILP
ncbi:MAG: hypothetical protein WAV70_04430, partial [Anaerolineae bacterium]